MDQLLLIVGVIGWISLIGSLYIYTKARKEKMNIVDKIYNDPKIVVIGGGTGQSVFLRGLKHVTDDITAIVTVADDGGGSGVLREDLGMLPPGDIRNCLLALANIEPTMNEVMQYRFTEGNLKGQNFGNLFIAAMNGVYGNFETAVSKMSEVLAITGRVLPVTSQDIKLVAKLTNGNIIKGESIIPKEAKRQKSKIDKVHLEPSDAKPLTDVIKCILEADVIVIGPGSLYTSIIPNLLVEGITDAIKASKAPKVYVANIMTQPGETDNYNVLNHIEAIINHSGNNVIDYVISNDEVLPKEQLKVYQKDGAKQVLLDKKQEDKLRKKGIKSIQDNLIEIKNNYIRHDARHISNIIIRLALSHNNDDI